MEMAVQFGILRWQRRLQTNQPIADQLDQKITALSKHYLQVTGNDIEEDFVKLNRGLSRKTRAILDFLENNDP